MHHSQLLSPFMVTILLVTSLAGSALPRAVANQGEVIDGLPELRIDIDDEGLTLPDSLLVGYTELGVHGRPEAALDPEGDLTRSGTSEAIFALYLVRVLDGDPPDFFDSPAVDQTVVGSGNAGTGTVDVGIDLLITLEVHRSEHIPLELVQVPGSVTFDRIEEDLGSGEPELDWLDSGFRPGFPLARTDGGPAQAVVNLPFTFPTRATYLIYAPDAPDAEELRTVYQAVAVRVGPGCEPDDAVSVRTGECVAGAGTVGDDDEDECSDADVTAHISRNSIFLGCGPFELGLQTWAIVNTTEDARTFAIYLIPADMTVDELREILRPDAVNNSSLSDLGIELEIGLSAFHGPETMLYVQHDPGVWAVVSTAEGTGDVTVEMFELVS